MLPTPCHTTSGQMGLVLTVHNPGDGAVYLDESYIQLPEAYQIAAGAPPVQEGGGAYELNVAVTPRQPGQGSFLPLLLEPGQSLGLTVTFVWEAPVARLQIGADLWELAKPTGTPAPTGQQPVPGGG